MKKIKGGAYPVKFTYECWKCPKWHETDEPIAAARYAIVRVTTPLGTIKFPNVTYLMQLNKLSDFSLTVFVGQYVQRCNGCNRLKRIDSLCHHGNGESFCFGCM